MSINKLIRVFVLLVTMSLSVTVFTANNENVAIGGVELNLPAYSSLGRDIANGRAVYSDNFYWITKEGYIGSTNRGWSRVPKENRNLVYLTSREAEAALDEASVTEEERQEQARKLAAKKEEQARKLAAKKEELARKLVAERKKEEARLAAIDKERSYKSSCEGDVSDPFAAFDVPDTANRLQLTTEINKTKIKLQATQAGCLWKEDSKDSSIIPKLIDQSLFKQNPNNKSQFIYSGFKNIDLVLDFTSYQCLSQDKSGTRKKISCYDSSKTQGDKTSTIKPRIATPSKVVKIAKPPPVPSIPEVSCPSLYKEFQANEMRALKKYKGKKIIITGRVTDIRADFSDNAQIILGTNANDFGMSSCMLSPPSSNQDFAYDLDKGEFIKLRCSTVNEMMGDPQAGNCTLVR